MQDVGASVLETSRTSMSFPPTRTQPSSASPSVLSTMSAAHATQANPLIPAIIPIPPLSMSFGQTALTIPATPTPITPTTPRTPQTPTPTSTTMPRPGMSGMSGPHRISGLSGTGVGVGVGMQTQMQAQMQMQMQVGVGGAAAVGGILGNGLANRTLLVEKRGKLHHAFPRALAPYPVNYDQSVIDADSLDLSFQLSHLTSNANSNSSSNVNASDIDVSNASNASNGFNNSSTSTSGNGNVNGNVNLNAKIDVLPLPLSSPSTIPHLTSPPKRCLDLGCGTGDWIIAASRAWPNTHFVGLDLVIGAHRIPTDLDLLDDSLLYTSDNTNTNTNANANADFNANFNANFIGNSSNLNSNGIVNEKETALLLDGDYELVDVDNDAENGLDVENHISEKALATRLRAMKRQKKKKPSASSRPGSSNGINTGHGATTTTTTTSEIELELPTEYGTESRRSRDLQHILLSKIDGRERSNTFGHPSPRTSPSGPSIHTLFDLQSQSQSRPSTAPAVATFSPDNSNSHSNNNSTIQPTQPITPLQQIHQHQHQYQLGQPISSRIEWVQANFLKPLPFAEGEFDYIRASGIARGVPEDKWDGLLAELSRVLAVDGYIEMIEEDVIFPICALPEEEEVDSRAQPYIQSQSQTLPHVYAENHGQPIQHIQQGIRQGIQTHATDPAWSHVSAVGRAPAHGLSNRAGMRQQDLFQTTSTTIATPSAIVGNAAAAAFGVYTMAASTTPASKHQQQPQQQKQQAVQTMQTVNGLQQRKPSLNLQSQPLADSPITTGYNSAPTSPVATRRKSSKVSLASSLHREGACIDGEVYHSPFASNSSSSLLPSNSVSASTSAPTSSQPPSKSQNYHQNLPSTHPYASAARPLGQSNNTQNRSPSPSSSRRKSFSASHFLAGEVPVPPPPVPSLHPYSNVLSPTATRSRSASNSSAINPTRPTVPFPTPLSRHSSLLPTALLDTTASARPKTPSRVRSNPALRVSGNPPGVDMNPGGWSLGRLSNERHPYSPLDLTPTRDSFNNFKSPIATSGQRQTGSRSFDNPGLRHARSVDPPIPEGWDGPPIPSGSAKSAKSATPSGHPKLPSNGNGSNAGSGGKASLRRQRTPSSLASSIRNSLLIRPPGWATPSSLKRVPTPTGNVLTTAAHALEEIMKGTKRDDREGIRSLAFSNGNRSRPSTPPTLSLAKSKRPSGSNLASSAAMSAGAGTSAGGGPATTATGNSGNRKLRLKTSGMDMSPTSVVPPVPTFPNKKDQGLRMPSKKHIRTPVPPQRPSLSASGAVQTPTSLKRAPKHPHELLQTLFFGVYERRFINTTPTAILPSFFNMYFQQVNVTPPIDFPMPPLPDRARELVRRRRRDMIQRELGGAGMEISQKLGMSLANNGSAAKTGPGAGAGSNPYGFGTQATNRNNEARLSILLHPRGSIGSGTPNATRIQEHNRQLKKTRSSPAMNVFLSDIVSDNEDEPEAADDQLRRGSESSQYSNASSDSPSSGSDSLLPTPITSHPVDPHIEGGHVEGPIDIRASRLAGDHGMDEFGLSLARPEEKVLKVEDEEEDARCAIMGEGGCFSPVSPSTADPLKKAIKAAERAEKTLSSHPSLSSLRKGSVRSGTNTNSQWYEDDSDLSRHGHDGNDLFNFLSLEEWDESFRGIEQFDHVAAEELGLYDGLFYEGTPEDDEQDVPEDVGETEEDEGRAMSPSPYPSANPAKNGNGANASSAGDGSGSKHKRKRTYVRPRTTFTGHGLPVPSSLLELDDTAMSVHLTRAWTNVVACKEAMWEELQRRAVTVYAPQSTDELSPTSTGAPIPLSPTKMTARRVTLLDEIQWTGSEQRLSDREKFELLFSRFEDDMRHWASVGTSLSAQLNWADPRGPTPRSKSTPPSTTNQQNTPVTASALRRPSNISSNSSNPNINNANPAQVHYGINDGMGPGTDGVVIPGVDMCRTLRVFTGRKMKEAHPPGGDGVKILGVV